MAACSSFVLQVNACVQKHSNVAPSFHHLKTSLSSSILPLWKELIKQMPLLSSVDVSKTIKSTAIRMVDALADSMVQFVDRPLLPSQRNFGPIEEIGEIVVVDCVEGRIPSDFPEGFYVRNGPNPLYGGLKSTVSFFGRTNHTWVEGDGMLHAVYFKKNNTESGDNFWSVSYNNKHVESDTFKLEKKRGKPCFIPSIEGDSPAILLGFLLNQLRFGEVNKYLSNTNVFEHGGKLYAISENHMPQEIDMFTLDTLGTWAIVNGAWHQPFTSHPKKAPGTGEMVIMGIDGKKPFYVVGVISADGKKLCHKVDLQFDKTVLSHEIGVTQKYNVILDYPLIIDIGRLFNGGSLIKYCREGVQARIGVMPRYGDVDSVQWFDVQSPHCTLHIFNSFEDGDEVVVRGCRGLTPIFPGSDMGVDRFEWFSKGFNFKSIINTADDDREINSSEAEEEDGFLFIHVYEWRLNMVTGEVREGNLTGTDFSMDFPIVNGNFTGLKHKYGYAQVIDSPASTSCGLPKYGAIAKLYFEEPLTTKTKGKEEVGEQLVKVEYHKFPENTFCSGIVFVPKEGDVEEDDGWIISYVHDEHTDESQVYIVDAKEFGSKPVAKITLPHRVPYGFHGNFVSTSNQP